MRVIFRTDASLQIGSGHVMRCLTLAEALRAKGADCRFVCREHPGHMLNVIRRRGFAVSRLAREEPHAQGAAQGVDDQPRGPGQEVGYAAWLGSTWQDDARETATILADLQPDWLVVDHYALDRRWERAQKPACGRIFAIDDLADRAHDCDLLLDQNLGRSAEHYARLVPLGCTVLTGPRYALLRPEFARLRACSLQRRRPGTLRHLLVTMGGVDADNATGRVLDALAACALPAGCRITVVMGAAAPWLHHVRDQAARIAAPVEVVVDVDDMAQRMADADLAFGAAGGTAWERCCLGLPTIVVVLAANQWPGALALEHAGAAVLLGAASEIARGLPPLMRELLEPQRLARVGAAASAVADGRGVDRVLNAMGVTHDGARHV